MRPRHIDKVFLIPVLFSFVGFCHTAVAQYTSGVSNGGGGASIKTQDQGLIPADVRFIGVEDTMPDLPGRAVAVPEVIQKRMEEIYDLTEPYHKSWDRLRLLIERNGSIRTHLRMVQNAAEYKTVCKSLTVKKYKVLDGETLFENTGCTVGKVTFIVEPEFMQGDLDFQALFLIHEFAVASYFDPTRLKTDDVAVTTMTSGLYHLIKTILPRTGEVLDLSEEFMGVIQAMMDLSGKESNWEQSGWSGSRSESKFSWGKDGRNETKRRYFNYLHRNGGLIVFGVESHLSKDEEIIKRYRQEFYRLAKHGAPGVLSAGSVLRVIGDDFLGRENQMILPATFSIIASDFGPASFRPDASNVSISYSRGSCVRAVGSNVKITKSNICHRKPSYVTYPPRTVSIGSDVSILNSEAAMGGELPSGSELENVQLDGLNITSGWSAVQMRNVHSSYWDVSMDSSSRLNDLVVLQGMIEVLLEEGVALENMKLNFHSRDGRYSKDKVVFKRGFKMDMQTLGCKTDQHGFKNLFNYWIGGLSKNGTETIRSVKDLETQCVERWKK